jgi:PhnB protein
MQESERLEIMADKTKPVPDGYEGVTPYLVLKDASSAIDFYTRALGAMETMRMSQPDGRVGHCDLKIGQAHIMLADEFPEMGFLGPQTRGGTTVGLLLYVDDCDATVQRAVSAGAKLARPVQDQFYGDRSGVIEDPFGHQWTIATHKEDVSPQEMERRMAAMKESGDR